MTHEKIVLDFYLKITYNIFSKLREARDPHSRDKAVKIAVKEMLSRSPSSNFRAACKCTVQYLCRETQP